MNSYEWLQFHIRRSYIFAKGDASLSPVILNNINSLFSVYNNFMQCSSGLERH